MTYNEECKEFGENLAMLVSAMINKKGSLRYSGQNSLKMEFYILLEGEKEELNQLCKDFQRDQGYADWHLPEKVHLFEFTGLARNGDSEICAMFNVTNETIHHYMFDHNLIGSMKSINKYDL